MVRPPASTLRRSAPARGAPVLPGDHLTDSIQLIGHAGLAIHRVGGAPTHAHLDDALEAKLARLELDVCASADGALVMLHDTCLPAGGVVADLSLAQLRRIDPQMLTIDEAVEHLAGRVPMLLDLKSAHASHLLGAWFRGRHDTTDFAACTENLPWLIQLRFAAPSVARWPSYPDVGDRRAEHIQRVVAGLWRSHSSLGGLRRSAADFGHSAMLMRRAPRESLIRLGGLPWRERLPQDIRQSSADSAAEGVCVAHWLLSEQLVHQAHRLGLHVNTWTVNNPFAARMACEVGVNSITTDRVGLVRLALQSQLSPPPGEASSGRVSDAARIAPG